MDTERTNYNSKPETHQINVVAEIGCNHKGDLKIAMEMIATAADFCNVHAVKFQKRTPRELLSGKEYNSPHPEPRNAYGNTYGEHREYLEFNLDEHKMLKEACDSRKIRYSASVWDLTAAKEICSLSPEFIKIPSACNLDYRMLKYICEQFGGEIHVSLGMTTKKEEDDIVTFFEKNKRATDVVLYSCTSDYPVQFEDVCLCEITRLRQKFATTIKQIGFSGHHLGIAVDIAAVTLGATWIERHLTMDRTWKGTDHAASLEPGGLRKLVRDIKNVKKSLSYKSGDILPAEKKQRQKLKRVDHENV